MVITAWGIHNEIDDDTMRAIIKSTGFAGTMVLEPGPLLVKLLNRFSAPFFAFSGAGGGEGSGPSGWSSCARLSLRREKLAGGEGWSADGEVGYAAQKLARFHCEREP